ncbi:MAG: M1 family metallopeptidase, partial [Bacteroidales bacterium]|nr:M1 family metallopeptidase [Bacteroidales bacterium]
MIHFMKYTCAIALLISSISTNANKCCSRYRPAILSSAVETFSDYDIKYYDFDFEFTPSSSEIEARVLVKARLSADVDTVNFALSSRLQISSVSINDSAFSYTHNKDKLSLITDDYLDVNEVFELVVEYQGDGLSRDVRGGVVSKKNQFKEHVVYTLSEPFSAQAWFPTNNVLTDKIDSAITSITVPGKYKAGSNGLLIDTKSVGLQRKKYTWKTNYPTAFYLFSVTVSDYTDYSYKVKLENQPDSLLIMNYVYNDDDFLKEQKGNIDETGKLISLYSKLFGVYPFYEEKYGHCMAPMGGGMEHQTMTTIANFGFGLVAHELAHQWFGNHVTCATWSDLWINEGFATYSEYLAYEALRSDSLAKEWLLYTMNGARESFGSIYFSENEAQDEMRLFNYELTYQKGAMVIHMIRKEISNDSLFFSV